MFVHLFARHLNQCVQYKSTGMPLSVNVWEANAQISTFQLNNKELHKISEHSSHLLLTLSACQSVTEDQWEARVSYPDKSEASRVTSYLKKLQTWRSLMNTTYFGSETRGIVLKRPDLSILRNIDLHNKIYLKGTQNILVDEQWMSEKVLFLCSIQNLILW